MREGSPTFEQGHESGSLIEERLTKFAKTADEFEKLQSSGPPSDARKKQENVLIHEITLGKDVFERALQFGTSAEKNGTMEFLHRMLTGLHAKPNKLLEFAGAVTVENMAEISRLAEVDPQTRPSVARLAAAVVENSAYVSEPDKAQWVHDGMGLLSANVDSIEAEFRDNPSDAAEKYKDVLLLLLKHGEDAIASRAAKIVVNSFRSKSVPAHELADAALYGLLSQAGTKELEDERTVTDPLKKRARQILSTLLSSYGLSPDVLIRAWNSSSRNEGELARTSPEGLFTHNLKNLRALENMHPGAAKVLSEKFGIMDFGRFPPELLSQQFENMENVEKPYGLIVLPRDDHNGSFSARSEQALQQLSSGLEGRYLLRAIEVESKMDLARKLIQMDKKYGAHQKIGFALVGAHSGAGMLVFGAGDRKFYSLNVDDFLGRGVKRSFHYFVKNPTVILWGCKAGKEGGIGQKLSAAMDAEVIGPKKVSAGIEKIKVRFDKQNKPRFSVTFEPGDWSLSASTKTYRSGKKKFF